MQYTSRSPDVRTSKPKFLSIKDDCQLYSCLFIFCQNRQCDLNEFFMHENQITPPSQNHNGCLDTGTNLDMKVCS